MIDAALRPGYVQIDAANRLELDSAAWEPFMRDVLGLPLSMLPAVQWTVRMNLWRRASDPLKCVRKTAERRAVRELRAAAKFASRPLTIAAKGA
jgi:hypothetical protein